MLHESRQSQVVQRRSAANPKTGDGVSVVEETQELCLSCLCSHRYCGCVFCSTQSIYCSRMLRMRYVHMFPVVWYQEIPLRTSSEVPDSLSSPVRMFSVKNLDILSFCEAQCFRSQDVRTCFLEFLEGSSSVPHSAKREGSWFCSQNVSAARSLLTDILPVCDI